MLHLAAMLQAHNSGTSEPSVWFESMEISLTDILCAHDGSLRLLAGKKKQSLLTIGSRLGRLGKLLSGVCTRRVSCDMHYYSTRVLLSLLAPSAPTFAEEC